MLDLLAGIVRRADGTPDPDEIDRLVAPYLKRAVTDLAPKAQASLTNALAVLEQKGFPVRIIESLRLDEVERAYFAKGRDQDGNIVRPDGIVTRAHDGRTCQHCYGLAVDLTSASETVVQVMHDNGWFWGGHWIHPDDPHFYPSKFPAVPTALDQADYVAGNIAKVQARYGYADPASSEPASSGPATTTAPAAGGTLV